MPLSLADFSINRAVLEIRYKEAFLLWDRTGSIFEQVRQSFPELELRKANPNEQAARLRRGAELNCKIDRAFILVSQPDRELAEFKSIASTVFTTICSMLELESLTRIGHRVFYEKRFESEEECADYLLAHAPALVRRGKHFNIEGDLTQLDIKWTWQNDKLGCQVHFHNATQKLDLEVPLEFGDKLPERVEKHAVIVDVDYYAHAVTPIERFDAGAIVENWSHLVRRDVGRFIDG